MKAKKMGAKLSLKYKENEKFNLKFIKIFNKILKNYKLRKILSNKAYSYLDTKGASRAAKFLLKDY
jgi:hypothetical protein